MLVCACLGCAALLAWAAPAMAAVGAGWLPQTSGTTAALTDVEMVGQTGWAVGANGTIIKTTDGGATWTAQPSGHSGWLFGVSFADGGRGWAVGGAYGASILATTDGGATWSVTSAPTESLRAVAAADATHAWAVGDAILATQDGISWSAQQKPADAGRLVDACAVDTQHAWAVGYGAIVATSDGGATWEKQYGDGTLTLTSVSFIDARDGWAAGYSGGGIFDSRAVLLATADGGATWVVRHRALTQSYFSDMVRLDDQRGWAVGCYDGVTRAVMATDDGGATWQLVGVTARHLTAVAGDATGACAVGDGGTVLATDGQPSPDDIAPVSSISGAGSGWRTRWVLRLTAQDQGVGVAMRQFSVDRLDRWQAGARLPLTSDETHSFDGTHRVYYRAIDGAGNVETARSVTIRIDTRRPRTTSPATLTVRQGTVARLKYLVTDRKPCAGWARVKVSFVAGDAEGNEHVVKVIRVGKVSVGAWHVLRFRCTLPRGTYICSIDARDAAGNPSGGAGTVLLVK